MTIADKIEHSLKRVLFSYGYGFLLLLLLLLLTLWLQRLANNTYYVL